MTSDLDIRLDTVRVSLEGEDHRSKFKVAGGTRAQQLLRWSTVV